MWIEPVGNVETPYPSGKELSQNQHLNQLPNLQTSTRRSFLNRMISIIRKVGNFILKQLKHSAPFLEYPTNGSDQNL